MNEYRSRLKRRIFWSVAAIAILIAVQVLSFAEVIRPPLGDGEWSAQWNAFNAGVALGLMVLLVIGVIRSVWAMRSETALRALCAKEQDERCAQIAMRARSSAVTFFLPALALAVIVSGYFNVTVSLTGLAVLLALAITAALFKLYWKTKL